MTTEPTGPSFPARLHVLLAGNSSQAVVIRRGPSKHVCVIGWDRSRDTFEEGQWLKGRIYERRCDLSPDGRHLIYFAMNGDEHELEHAARGVKIACPDWEWAERDGGRLVYASHGCLYRVGRPAGKAVGLGEATLVQDFNGMRFVARGAPYR